MVFTKVDKTCKGSNLHSEWDAIPASLGTAAQPAMVKQAHAVPPTAAPMEGFAAAWASDTLLASHSTFSGVKV